MMKTADSRHANKSISSGELWLISVPIENNSLEESRHRLYNATQNASSCYSQNFRFNIPDLKVGTLDQLVGLADDLQSTDAVAERVCKKLVAYFETVLDREKDKLAENLVVGNNMDPFTYVTKFSWDFARFPVRLPLKGLEAMILKRTSQIENELKSRSAAFDEVNHKMQAEEKAQKGNLFTRDISGLVKESDFILGSENMKTMLVCVPKNSYRSWYDSYETLSPMVVPRSTVKLAEDDEFGLFSVIIFRKVEESFCYACRQHKFYVKNFDYDRGSIDSRKDMMKQLAAERAQQFGPLVRWLKVNFSEAFIDWIHVKALRVFVESVLRYGLPVNFFATVLQPNPKSKKKLTDIINKLYDHLGAFPAAEKTKGDDEVVGFEIDRDYRPYVFFKIELDDFIEPSRKE